MSDDIPIDPVTIPPDRARIEPTPSARRRDILPILYLLGFAVLAFTLVYLYRHPMKTRGALQEAQQVNSLHQDLDAARQENAALAARLKQVEDRPVTAPIDLAPVDARLRALEARPLPQPVDLAPIQARIDAADKKAADATNAAAAADKRAADATSATDSADKRAAEAIAGLDQKSTAAMAALATALTAKLDQLAQGQAALAPRVDALEPRLGNLEAAQRRADTAIAATTQRAQGYGRLQAAAVALEAGQKLGTIPNAPPALTRFAQVAPPTQATLRQTFPAAANAARRASPAVDAGEPFMNRMWDRAQRSVTVRQGDSILMGDPINGILAHARQALDAGDLAAAVHALADLPQSAQAAMSDWINQAQSLLDARAALADLAARG